MNLSPESVKETLLNKVNEMSASSWQYVKKPTDFTRNRKISFNNLACNAYERRAAFA